MSSSNTNKSISLGALEKNRQIQQNSAINLRQDVQQLQQRLYVSQPNDTLLELQNQYATLQQKQQQEAIHNEDEEGQLMGQLIQILSNQQMSMNIPEELKQEALVLLRAKLTESVPVGQQETSQISKEEIKNITNHSSNLSNNNNLRVSEENYIENQSQRDNATIFMQEQQQPSLLQQGYQEGQQLLKESHKLIKKQVTANNPLELIQEESIMSYGQSDQKKMSSLTASNIPSRSVLKDLPQDKEKRFQRHSPEISPDSCERSAEKYKAKRSTSASRSSAENDSSAYQRKLLSKMFVEKENVAENQEKHPITEKRNRNAPSNMLLASQGSRLQGSTSILENDLKKLRIDSFENFGQGATGKLALLEAEAKAAQLEKRYLQEEISMLRGQIAQERKMQEEINLNQQLLFHQMNSLSKSCNMMQVEGVSKKKSLLESRQEVKELEAEKEQLIRHLTDVDEQTTQEKDYIYTYKVLIDEIKKQIKTETKIKSELKLKGQSSVKTLENIRKKHNVLNGQKSVYIRTVDATLNRYFEKA